MTGPVAVDVTVDHQAGTVLVTVTELSGRKLLLRPDADAAEHLARRLMVAARQVRNRELGTGE